MTAAQAIETSPVARGGRKKGRDGPERRCIASGESGPTDRLVRFVLGPDGHAVPDIAGKLPGRGAWLTADRALVDKAVKKRLFSRAFRQPVEVAENLADRLEALIAGRMVDLVSLARKAGQAVTGAEKVRAHLQSGQAGVLLQALDGAQDGRAKLARLAEAIGNGAIEQIELLSSKELGLAFGREFAIHAALDAGGFAQAISAEAKRLQGLRADALPGGQTDERPLRGTEGHDPSGSSEHQGKGPGTGTQGQDDR